MADEVVITPIFKPEAVPEGERLTTASVVNGIREAGKPAREIADADAIIEAVTPGCAVVTWWPSSPTAGLAAFMKAATPAGRVAQCAAFIIARTVGFCRSLLALLSGWLAPRLRSSLPWTFIAGKVNSCTGRGWGWRLRSEVASQSEAGGSGQN